VLRYKAIEAHVLSLLVATCGMVVGQAVFFTLMAGNHRVARIARTNAQSAVGFQPDSGSHDGTERAANPGGPGGLETAHTAQAAVV
jgi:hypothetical protein